MKLREFEDTEGGGKVRLRRIPHLPGLEVHFALPMSANPEAENPLPPLQV